MGFRLNVLPSWPKYVLTAMLLLLPPVAYYASKGLVALLLVGAALLVLDSRVMSQFLSSPKKRLLLFFAPLFCWGLISTFWSILPFDSVLLAFRLAILFLSGLLVHEAVKVLDADERVFLIKIGAACGIVLLFLVGADLLSNLAVISWLKHLRRGPGTNDYLTYINAGVAMLALISWPAALCLHRVWGWKMAVAFMALTVLAIWKGNAATPLAALLLAGTVIPFVFFFGRAAVRIVFGGLGAYVLATPLYLHFVVGPFFEPLKDLVKSWSMLHRLEIWHFTYGKFLEKPWFGWGLAASREIPGGHGNVPGFVGAELLPLHPHNGALQIWLELGAVGVFAYLVALFGLGSRLEEAAADRASLALVVAAFLGFFVQAQLSFGAWQNWWLSGVALMAMLCQVSLQYDKNAA